jgi:hypothetical protein
LASYFSATLFVAAILFVAATLLWLATLWLGKTWLETKYPLTHVPILLEEGARAYSIISSDPFDDPVYDDPRKDNGVVGESLWSPDVVLTGLRSWSITRIKKGMTKHLEIKD